MAGLTRFLFLMNLCEKSATLTPVYNGFTPFKKMEIFAARKIFLSYKPISLFFCRANRLAEMLAKLASLRSKVREDFYPG